MSKRAEERALKAYQKEDRKVWTSAFGTFEFDKNAPERRAFQEGYERAEKDLALSIDDIEKIHTFLYSIKNNKHGAFTFTRLSNEQYKEVLRRFKAIKEDRK